MNRLVHPPDLGGKLADGPIGYDVFFVEVVFALGIEEPNRNYRTGTGRVNGKGTAGYAPFLR